MSTDRIPDKLSISEIKYVPNPNIIINTVSEIGLKCMFLKNFKNRAGINPPTIPIIILIILT